MKLSKRAIICIFLSYFFFTCSITNYAEGQSSDGYIKVSDGIRLFYRIEGSGGDPIVVLHGGPGFSMAYIRPDLLRLSQDRTVIFYDQRGSGRSTVTDDPDLLRLSKYIEDLDMLRRYFNLEKLTLLGHSWGTGLAALYAIKYPERIKEMLLVGPMEVRSNPYTEQFLSNMTSWMDEVTHKRFSELIVLKNKAEDVTWCNEFFTMLFRSYFSDPAKMNKMKGDICADPPEGILNGQKIEPLLIEELGDWDWRDSLRNVKSRTLIVYGLDDIFPIESAREWADSLFNARIIIIPESGHFPYVEQPDIFFKVVEDFLRGSWPENSVAIRNKLKNGEYY